MKPSFYTALITFILLAVVLALLTGCAKGPWVPENVGREYGSPKIPFVVSHLPERNKWAMARTSSHSIFRQVLCFDYACRRMIGRRKVLRAISMKDFRKAIAKNAKAGAYKNMVPHVPPSPAIKKPKKDSIVIKRDTVRIAKAKLMPALEAPVLKADSLITLSDFLFETDSYKLKEEHFSQLDSLSRFLLAHPSLEVSVTGHTDNTGNERHNVNLSAHRAEVVAQYLINKGIVDEKIIFEGFGSAKPITGNDTAAGRGKNRRVEILIRNPKRK